MIDIQELGLSILSDSPKKFYVLGGPEYGVKDKYLDHLWKLYGKKEEYAHVEDVISMMSTRRLIPLQPTLYVVRYDDAFVSKIDGVYAEKIRKTNIIGTIVCIYIDDKHINKIDKFLPESVCTISLVNPKFVERYLHQDFPKLDDRSIRIATDAGDNYGHSRNICRSMSCTDVEVLARMSEKEICSFFGCHDASTEKNIQVAIAARNFPAFYSALSEYSGDLSTIYYSFLQTMIELEKIKSSKYSNSELRDYAKAWSIEDIYYMFMNVYRHLELSRSSQSTDISCSLIYLASLFTFQHVPSPEVMEYGA